LFAHGLNSKIAFYHVLPCRAMLCFAVPFPAPSCTALSCTALSCTVLSCTALHCPVASSSAPLLPPVLTCSHAPILITYAHMHNTPSCSSSYSLPHATSCTYAQAYAPLRPLVLVLKYFLTRKGLCEAFTGGLSSYALLLVTARFLQEVQDLSYLIFLIFYIFLTSMHTQALSALVPLCRILSITDVTRAISFNFVCDLHHHYPACVYHRTR
jgi:hypothetical protein